MKCEAIHPILLPRRFPALSVGNFLAIMPSVAMRPDGGPWRQGLGLAARLGFRQPSGNFEAEWIRAVTFRRDNGSGGALVKDGDTGSFLIALGTWFHTGGYAVGAEECLLRRYLEVGPMQLGRELEGFFCLIVGDGRSRETVAITDVAGSCHGFVRPCSGGIALSGSSLLLAGLEGFSLDPVACQEYLHTGVIYEDRTVYREVRKLAAASVYRFAPGAPPSVQRYWDVTGLDSAPLAGRTAVAILWETLVAAAQRIGRVSPRLVCDLTGGYDSRALACALAGGRVPFTATVSGPDDSPDVRISRGLAGLAGWPHAQVADDEPLTYARMCEAIAYTDGEFDSVEYARILGIHRMLAKDFDISLNGSYGEIARGYWWELLYPKTGWRARLDARRLACLRFAAPAHDASLFPPVHRLDMAAHFSDVIERTNAGLSASRNTLQMDHAYLRMRMQRWQGRIASSTNRLWPCLSPFMFRSVLETMLRVEPRERRRSLLIRRMLGAYQPRLAAYPLEHGHPALPVNWRTFYRFWPLVGRYGGKVLRRAARLPGGQGAGQGRREPARLRLWREQEVRALLQPEGMALGEFLDRPALADYLARSRGHDFPYDGQWQRLLSLEATLQGLRGAIALSPI